MPSENLTPELIGDLIAAAEDPSKNLHGCGGIDPFCDDCVSLGLAAAVRQLQKEVTATKKEAEQWQRVAQSEQAATREWLCGDCDSRMQT